MSLILDDGSGLLLEDGSAPLLEGESVLVLTTFREVIYQYISTLPALTAVVGDRISYGKVDRGAGYPNLVFLIPYSRSMHGRSYGVNLDGSDGTSTAHVLFTVTALREDDCIRAIRALAALEDLAGDQGGIDILDSHIEFEWDLSVKPPDGTDQWIHQLPVEYRIKHRATPVTA